MDAPPQPNTRLISFVLKFLTMAALGSMLLLFILMAAFVFAGVTFVHRRRWSIRPPLEREFPRVVTGLSSKELMQLPEIDYGGDPAECAVCLERFADGERCRSLPICGHVFHVRCVDIWLVKTAACPVCRSIVAGGWPKAVDVV